MTRILCPGETCWVSEPVHQAGLLVDGCAYYRHFYECAKRATEYILLSGWQFDSTVELVRGRDVDDTWPTALLPFLNELCRLRPRLRVYILAWDFHVVYALEREALQRVAFDWMTHARLHFVFDDCVPMEGSHHQKFAVIDGQVGFVGGVDLCEHRWDDRHHRLDNPLRVQANGVAYTPYHETQVFFTGPAVRRLCDFFIERWRVATKSTLRLQTLETRWELPRPRGCIPIRANELAFCRTSVAGPGKALREVRALMTTAMRAAERFVYIETQYFTSRAVAEALEARMQDAERPRLDIVFVVPPEPEAPKESLAMGVAQAHLVRRLRRVAKKTGHRIGFYSTASVSTDGTDIATYIHSKLVIVDDRFLTVGSANLNNRSMGVDTELNVAFEAREPTTRLGRSIRRLRTSLLAEHVGARTLSAVRALARADGLVARLDAWADQGTTRLRVYRPIDPTEDDALLDVVHTSIGLYLDPEEPRLARDLERGRTWRKMASRAMARIRERVAHAMAGLWTRSPGAQ